ncbi:MAG: protein kinase, partial [Gemmataceae bacterium]|nr:protein kinase [Gemmataceae bacterium]
VTVAPSAPQETADPPMRDPYAITVPSDAHSAAADGPTVKYFGEYELLAEIARGGMGVVYKARQRKLNRLVALKMILAGQLASEAEVQRFYTEAEAAANLDHPGIVPIYEIGQQDGQHFFSMAFIEGTSLQARIKDGPLPPREAAAIIRAVAEAVAYAHTEGILHRDLKPANILLDRSGQPKVTDFGLAKKLNTDSNLTGTGQVIGTPSYMAPEQAGGKIREAGPAADVYSLGATLYCLLTGRPPFQSATVMDTLLQVLEQEPVPPRTLNPSIPKDLETVCLKCLHKESSRRYGTARELAEDLGRFLADEPILARPVSRAERFWRWCRRNPLLATAALSACFFLGISLGLLVAINRTSAKAAAELSQEQQATLAALATAEEQKTRAESNLADALRQRDEAQRQTARADKNLTQARQAVENYLTKVAEHPKLKAGDFHDLRKQLLETAVPFYEEFTRQQSADPNLLRDEARALSRLAELREDLGETVLALQDLERANTILARLIAAHPAAAEPRHQLLSNLYQLSYLLFKVGRPQEAEAARRQVLAGQQKLVEDFPDRAAYRRELAGVHTALADLLTQSGQSKEAETHFQQGLALLKRLVADFPAERGYQAQLAWSQTSLASGLMSDKGRLKEAETASRQALELYAKLVTIAPDHAGYRSGLAHGHEVLGGILGALGHHEEQETHSRQALAIYQKLTSDFPTPDSRSRLARSYQVLGYFLGKRGRHAEQEAAYRQAIALYEKLVADFPVVATYRTDLAGVQDRLIRNLVWLKRSAEAESACRQWIAEREKLAVQFPAVLDYTEDWASSLRRLGFLFVDAKRPEAALEPFAQAIAILEPVVAKNPQPPQTPRSVWPQTRGILWDVHYGRATALGELGRKAEAVHHWDAVLELDDDKARSGLLIQRGWLLLKLQAHLRQLVAKGDHVQATTEANKLTEAKKPAGDLLYLAAGVFSRSSAAAKEDAALAERYAAQAVELLSAAAASGYFRNPTVRAELGKDSNLTPLRQREDYRRLLTQLDLIR